MRYQTRGASSTEKVKNIDKHLLRYIIRRTKKVREYCLGKAFLRQYWVAVLIGVKHACNFSPCFSFRGYLVYELAPTSEWYP